MDEIQKLTARLTELHEISKGITAKADAEKRDMTVAEQTELDKVMDEFSTVEADLARRKRIQAQEARLAAPAGRQAAPNPIGSPAPIENSAPAPQPRAGDNGLRNTVLSTVEQRQRWGFGNFGEFCSAVRKGVTNPGNMDQRLIQNAAASTYGSEGAGADGGFAVPPEWRAEITQLTEGENSLMGMVDQQTVAGNSITFPVDETTAWQTTGGILAYWDTEAAAMTQSKPALKDLTLKLNRLTALVPVTEELLEDAPAMAGYVTRKAGEKLAFKISDAIVNGTGVGQPLGLMNSPCKIQVSKIGSQVADTIHAKNIVTMWARLPAASQRNAVWLINQDCLPQVYQLGFAVTDGTTSNVGAGALYMGPGQMAGGAPSGTLLGRPIVVTEACAAIGDIGDIILWDPTKYLLAKKGAMRADTSIHLWFDQNITAFRFVMRMNGQPWLSAAIARRNGSNTLSHVIYLEAR
jgi:HK97 family phage major capsid protein